jgi:hypothetical protein
MYWFYVAALRITVVRTGCFMYTVDPFRFIDMRESLLRIHRSWAGGIKVASICLDDISTG